MSVVLSYSASAAACSRAFWSACAVPIQEEGPLGTVFVHIYSSKVTCALISPLYINLNLLSCPPGFSLQGDPPGCDCYPVLTDNGVKCYINNRKMIYFSWNTSFWMSITLNNTVYSKYCPFNYCNNAKSIQSVVDKQCAFNRAGRLCGECKESFSLAIGSSHCIHCPTYNNLALLIFFAAAGFMLVVLISVLTSLSLRALSMDSSSMPTLCGLIKIFSFLSKCPMNLSS